MALSFGRNARRVKTFQTRTFSRYLNSGASPRAPETREHSYKRMKDYWICMSGQKMGRRGIKIRRFASADDYDLSLRTKRIQENNLSFPTRELLTASIRAISVTNRLLFVFFLRGFREHLEFRIILQLHHVHGGEQRRADRSGAQLSSQIARQIRDAKLGKKI